MSNQEENKASDGRSLDDIFVGLGGDVAPLSKAEMGDLAGVPEIPLDVKTGKVESNLPEEVRFYNVDALKAKPKFQIPGTKTRAEKMAEKVTATSDPLKDATTTDERIAAMEQMIIELRSGMNGVKLGSASAKDKKIVLDFSKISEEDVFNLNIPIEIIEHQVPDYTKIVLKDPTYHPHWVQAHPARLGPMKAAGFTYITAEDLAEELEMALEEDENGHYRFIDLIAMKCSKSKYFGALRRNYIRSLAQTNPKIVHQMAKQTIENSMGELGELTRDGNDFKVSQPRAGGKSAYARHKEANHIGVFSPNLSDGI